MSVIVDWRRIRLVVFDVDGTLYDAARLRRRMAGRLLAHCLRHPREVKVLRQIAAFRRCREELAESEAPGVAELQFRRPAEVLGVSPEEIRRTVEEWMLRRPLVHLAACRHANVADLFELLRESGRLVAVYSDYPAAEKVSALGLAADLEVCALDRQVDRLKPHPRGLQRVLELTNIDPEAALMIGDRQDRDGECARRAGVPCLIKTGGPASGPGEFRHYADLVGSLHPDEAQAAALQ